MRRSKEFDDLMGGENDPFAGMPELLTIDEAARVLRVSRSTMYSYVSSGLIRRSVLRGGKLLFRRDTLVDEYWRARQRAFRPRSSG